MILVPEIETVVILVPRTGSGSLKLALMAQYPQALPIYRHMEADGVPGGYDRWRRVGVVRHPVERLWSLYKFLRRFDGPYHEAYIAEMRASVASPFCDWLVENQTVFTSPYDSAGLGRFWPKYSVRHPLPETRKSQFLYLRPDLGTEVWTYDDLPELWASLGVADGLPVLDKNRSDEGDAPGLTPAAWDHVQRVFAWDLKAARARG